MIRSSRTTQLREINNQNIASDFEHEEEEENKQILPSFDQRVLRFYRAKNYKKCIKTIDRILKVTPQENSLHYKILLAASYTMIGKKFKKSHSILNDVLRVKPLDSYALYGKGVAYYFQGDFDKSIEFLDKAIEANPSDMNQAKDLKIKIDLKRNQAMVMIKKLELEVCKDSSSDSDDINKDPAEEGIENLTLNEHKRSQSPASNKSDDDPLNTTILTPAQEMFNKGLDFYMSGSLAKSLKYFGKALKMEPDFEEAEEMGAKAQELIELLEVAEMNINEKNYEVVVEIINQAIDVDDGNDSINKLLYFKRGLAYFHLKENELSLKDYAMYEKLKNKIELKNL